MALPSALDREDGLDPHLDAGFDDVQWNRGSGDEKDGDHQVQAGCSSNPCDNLTDKKNRAMVGLQVGGGLGLLGPHLFVVNMATSCYSGIS